MGRYFGTDGVRGLANVELSPLLALKLGTTAAHALIERKQGKKILVGRDPRISGDILESALVAGICSQGVDAVLIGVIPTPGVAFLTASSDTSAGVVISASHNPVRDNGIKFFGEDGYKLDDAVEASIEDQIDNFDNFPRPQGGEVGNIFRRHEMVWKYAKHVKSTTNVPLDGLKLVIDGANGAASELAPAIFHELGAKTMCLNCTPNGTNINDGNGSQHPQQMSVLVKQVGADVGMSFDGDADRVILSDENGNIVDGDRVMAIYALHCARNGGLPINTVVGTVMSNIGLEIALKKEKLKLVRTAVGDRYVSDEMRRSGAIVGGEKSGHIILSRHTTTGDGMITALQILTIMIQTGKRLSELAGEMTDFPQLLVNVKVAERDGWDEKPEIMAAIADAEQKLGDRGRVVVRPSGTEKLIRVMAEGQDQSEVECLVHGICDVVKKVMG
ncbi:MAG: phosphoglucosamine mutase [Armatimonadota bacterium]|nr:phosphoglucosamine mutase [bacterium]